MSNRPNHVPYRQFVRKDADDHIMEELRQQKERRITRGSSGIGGIAKDFHRVLRPFGIEHVQIVDGDALPADRTFRLLCDGLGQPCACVTDGKLEAITEVDNNYCMFALEQATYFLRKRMAIIARICHIDDVKNAANYLL